MRKLLIVSMVVFTVALTLTACSKANEVQVGTYHADNDMATVTVQEDGTMMITGPKEVSAAFTGKYVVERNKLILSIAEQEDHIFSIEEQGLVLESGEWLENWVEQGTAFHLA